MLLLSGGTPVLPNAKTTDFLELQNARKKMHCGARGLRENESLQSVLVAHAYSGIFNVSAWHSGSNFNKFYYSDKMKFSG